VSVERLSRNQRNCQSVQGGRDEQDRDSFLGGVLSVTFPSVLLLPRLTAALPRVPSVPERGECGRAAGRRGGRRAAVSSPL